MINVSRRSGVFASVLAIAAATIASSAFAAQPVAAVSAQVKTQPAPATKAAPISTGVVHHALPDVVHHFP